MEKLSNSLLLFKKYKIPVAETKQVKSWEDIEKLKKKWKSGVVLKIDTSGHKKDVGGVVVDPCLRDFEKIKKLGKIVAQKKIEGKEVIIGAKEDPSFGKVILFGLGGTFVEVFEDVSFRVTPFSRKEALSMIDEIKGVKLLEGFRGGPKVSKRKLAEIILKVAKMVEKEDIKELDINPLICNSKEIVAVDGRFLK